MTRCLAVFELGLKQVFAIVGVVAPVVRRACKNVDAKVCSTCHQTAHASDTPDATKNIVAFFTSEVCPIDNALAHVQAIVDKRSRVVDIVTGLDIRDNKLGKRRSRSAIGHKATLEQAGQQKVAGLAIGLGITRPLDVHVTVELEEIHFAVTVKFERKINRNIIHGNGITLFFEIGSTLYLVDIHF